MNDKILDWINEVMESRKESILEYILSKELDDTFGWGKLLCSYLNVSEDMMRTKRGLLLTGPRGCGKHTAAYHVVKYLCSKNQWAVKHNADPFDVEFLSGDDLRFPDSEWYKVFEFVRSIFESYIGDMDKKLCLVVDEPFRSSHPKELFEILSIFSCLYAVHEEILALYIIIISEEEGGLPAILRERLHRCRMMLPNREKRWQFFKENILEFSLRSFLDSTESELNYDMLADMTEDMSYADMRDLVTNMELYARMNIQETSHNVASSEFVRGQLSQDSFEVTQRKHLMKLDEILDELPEMLRQMPVSVQSGNAQDLRENNEERNPEVTAGYDQSAEEWSEERLENEVVKERRKSETMSFDDLFDEATGGDDDFGNELMQMADELED